MLHILWSLMLVLLFAVNGACSKSTNQRGDSRPRKTVEERFAEKDADKDGKLSLQEFKGGATQPDQIARLDKAFKDADTDHNGSLSLDEYKVYQEKRRSERRGGGGRYGPMGGKM
jgi:Ca2+-binding EF-hand superfamily protein